ncbi:MAG: hypothetical protein ACKOC5_14055 [Chloroflexota bacterium]
MSFNEITIQAYYQAVKLMYSGSPVAQGMLELDRLARALAPHSVWDRLRQVDFAAELPALQSWAAAEIARRPQDVAVLHWRLADLGEAMWLAFLRPLRPPAGDDDWQAYDHSQAAPAPSSVLAQMAGLAESELTNAQGEYTHPDVGWIVETCYPLAYAGLTAARIAQDLPPQALLGDDPARAIAVFFNEGDEFILGRVDRQGFRYHPLPDFIA